MPRRPAFRLTPVSGVLDQVLRQYGLEGKFREYRVMEQWPEVVGETLARHTVPEGIRYRKLILRVDSSAWMQQLTFFKKDILDKVNAALGENAVSDIQMKIGQMEE
jgi:predicted nucleic acid-binding Zn ribbon protein